jgi:site-specific DNA recombinase
MKNVGCYIYTRVSTAIQVDGYSLDAQKEKLRKYAEYQNYKVIKEFSDEGKSGKSIEGRQSFQDMMKDIENRVDDVEFVLVFKLSRFGRNAADVLNSLQLMQDYGVNLICVEDGIDSSKDSGKLMISVLSSVAEIERENILVQTMEGRKQKAREGKWNGGFAPYGYKLVDGELKIADDEIGVIKTIFDKYLKTSMGASSIASFLNHQGIKKKLRQNNTLDVFTTSFVTKVLDNPIYSGKMAYGRRSNVKIKGTRNQYHIVEQDSYMMNDGTQEAIITPEQWKQVQTKRKEIGGFQPKTHSLDHEHVLSGLVICPDCGKPLMGNVSRKKRKDGTLYKDYFYYACKHRSFYDGHRCNYRKQWNEELIDNAVIEKIKLLVKSPEFAKALKDRIGKQIDTKELDVELENMKKTHLQAISRKDKLSIQMDSLSINTPHYDSIYQDMQNRLFKFYDEISGIEKEEEELRNRIDNIRKQKVTAENVYSYLVAFDKIIGKCTDLEKKELLRSFIEKIEIFPERQPDRRIIKSIKFKFPVFAYGEEQQTISWDNLNHVETVCALSLKEH